MLTLKDFVKTTLSEITEALLEFEDAEIQRGRNITPFPKLSSKTDVNSAVGFLASFTPLLDSSGNQKKRKNGTLVRKMHAVMPVEFDVAVTATSEGEIAGGFSLRVVEMFKAGVDAKEATLNSSVSRVCFKVPVQLSRDNT